VEEERESYTACTDPNCCNEDPGEYEMEKYFVCKDCGEEITPMKLRTPTVKWINGPTTYRLTTTQYVTKEEAEAWLKSNQAP
jgi:hypothetical protein